MNQFAFSFNDNGHIFRTRLRVDYLVYHGNRPLSKHFSKDLYLEWENQNLDYCFEVSDEDVNYLLGLEFDCDEVMAFIKNNYPEIFL